MTTLTFTSFDSESFCGYKQITTFFQDFSIAEPFGKNAIKDTYKRALEYAKTDYKYLTELVLVLNWKIWQHYEDNPELGKIYNTLWQKTDEYACNNLKDAELSYFFRTTD